MFGSKVFRAALVAVMLLALVFPADITVALGKQAKKVSLHGDSHQLFLAKVDWELAMAFAKEDFVHILIQFKDQADPQLAAAQATDKLPANTTAYQQKLTARNAVVDALRETAAATQGFVLDYLRGEQDKGNVKEVDSYFIVNMIHALATKAVVEELALRPEIGKILPSGRVALEPIVPAEDTLSGPGRQWNLENIGAYAVWDTYGLDGTGIVVGMIDTGTHYTHEALVEKWRGNLGGGVFDPVFNWFDAIDGQSMPYDEPAICHGTHVMGTILGGHPETGNLIGVAPGAKWITAKAFDEEGGYDHWILAAAEYLLAPTDEHGDPNPAMAPDVINNSWGGGSGLNEWFRPMVQSWRAAQILPIFSAGNTTGGSSPGSVSAPANYPECLAVAAVNVDNLRGNFSNQGPGPYEDLKPDLSAPGVAIRSSVIGGYEATWSGTSMASPHVTGTAALLLQADGSLNIDQIEEILYDTAAPLTDSQYPGSPNYGYGRGLVNAFDAVATTLGGFGTISGQVLTSGQDNELPQIEHTPVECSLQNQDISLTARISDDVSVVGAQLWVLPANESEGVLIPLERIAGNHRDGQYQGVVPGKYVVEPGFTYKITVRDWAGNLVETPAQFVQVLFGIQPGYLWDFESEPGDWYMDGDWEWGEPLVGPQPLTGAHLVGTNLKGNYSVTSDSWLVTPPLDLRHASEASLRLQHWYDIETNWDGGTIIVTTDLVTGEVVADVTGKSQGWQDLFINLNHYCGCEEQVYVLFAFESDYSVCYPGWYIDAVQFIGVDDQAPAAPENLTATATNTGIALTWDSVTEMDVAGYGVYRSETPMGPYEPLGQTPALSYMDKNTTGGIEYCYVVTAVDFSGNESPYSNEAVAVAPAIELLFSADFEGDEGGFVSGGSNNSWQWGVPVSGPGAAFSGVRVWATNLAGNYDNYSDCWLQSPAIDLSTCPAAVLEFAHWLDAENNWDKAYVELTTNGGVSWSELVNYTGAKTQWGIESISLAPYMDQIIQIRFRLSADVSNNRPGWYLDDVSVIGFEPTTGNESSTFSVSHKPSAVYTFSPSGKGRLNSARNPGGALLDFQNDGIPVDAIVTVVESKRTVRTNPATGQYQMLHPAVPTGETWTLRFEAYGYYPAEVPFTLERDQVQTVNQLLDPIPRGSIVGRVVSARTGEPIPAAKLILLEDGRVPCAYSDEEGNFRWDEIIEGNYTLRATAQNYILQEITLQVTGGETASPLLELTPFIGFEDEISYDDGVADNAFAWYDGGNGWGVRFTPDVAAQVIGANIYIWGYDWPSPGGNKFAVAVFDSASNGDPGQMVIAPFVIEGNRGDWNYVDLSEYGFSTHQDFYIFYVQMGNHPNCAGLGFDDNSPWSGRTYEWFAGEFALADPNDGNAMVRAVVKYLLSPPVLTAPSEGTYVNTDEILVSGHVVTDAQVTLYVNEEEAWQEEVPRGVFQAEVALSEGENRITATATIPAGATDPCPPLLVIKDTVAPDLTLISPLDGQLIGQEVITVTGRADDSHLARVTVNGSAVDFHEDGTFSAKYIAEVGENRITVGAEDFAGNSTEITVTVTVLLTTPELYNLQPAEDVSTYSGRTITVSFCSDTMGGRASFAVILPGLQPAVDLRQPMAEVSPGEYRGAWQIPEGTTLVGAVVEFELIDLAGNRGTAVAPGRITVRPLQPPMPLPDLSLPECLRLAGDDRYATAALISREGWETSEYVVLARGDNYADALTGASLAYALDAPILLTEPTKLTGVTGEEIRRLKAATVIILGGGNAVGEAVEIALAQMDLQVERIAGNDRFETATLIAARLAPKGAGKVALVNGFNFPDALSVAAYAARGGMPILLTLADNLPAVTAAAFEKLDVLETVVVGGSAVIQDDVFQVLPGALRVGGSDRYATSVALAEHFGINAARIYVATGLQFTDALSGAVLAAKNDSGILLVGDSLPHSIADYISKRLVYEAVILGGENAVSAKLAKELSLMLK